jgi:hypothetical protein
MKATVWTSWNAREVDSEKGRPKCIFDGEIFSKPAKGEYVTVRDGFCTETVVSVIHDLVNGGLEITVRTSDSGDKYGKCLRNSRHGKA